MSAPLPVYQLMPIHLVHGNNCTVWDSDGNSYLDLYGGHGVISIGHAHPEWSAAISKQSATLGYYSNSVKMEIQEQAAAALGRLSKREDCNVFFVNSGAEANENALKLASFVTGRKRVVCFSGAFHGRTSLAVAATDNPKIVAPINQTNNIVHLPLNDVSAVANELEKNDVAAVLIEGIQGVGGVQMPTDSFLQDLFALCNSHDTMLVLDEIQSGGGRTGKYFAHDYAAIKPHMVTMAKGIGNGYPVGAVLVDNTIPVSVGMLGTTFGGAHMACAAVNAVASVMEKDQLMRNAEERGRQLQLLLCDVPGIHEVRGRGLMLGIVLNGPCNNVREQLWRNHHILTGNASDQRVLRILPPLSISPRQIEAFASALIATLQEKL